MLQVRILKPPDMSHHRTPFEFKKAQRQRGVLPRASRKVNLLFILFIYLFVKQTVKTVYDVWGKNLSAHIFLRARIKKEKNEKMNLENNYF